MRCALGARSVRALSAAALAAALACGSDGGGSNDGAGGGGTPTAGTGGDTAGSGPSNGGVGGGTGGGSTAGRDGVGPGGDGSSDSGQGGVGPGDGGDVGTGGTATGGTATGGTATGGSSGTSAGSGGNSSTACGVNTPLGACGAGQRCQGGRCVATSHAASCGNGVTDLLETGVDCGGPRCGPCPNDAPCREPSDCRSLACESNRCVRGRPSFLVDEDFEDGDFSRFPYLLSSTNQYDWAIESDPDACRGGSYCARSSPFQMGGETASLALPLSVRADTSVSFWAKTDTEDNEHFLRFFIDDVELLELSGQTDWELYTFPVTATGAGGADRVLRWEYTRSTFVEPSRPPRNSVWLDDVDLPEWNSQPTLPRLVTPGNGRVVTDRAPLFTWFSSDADFDSIVFEAQYSTDAAFAAPVSTGETFDFRHVPAAPLADDTVYFWRVRAKDVSDYRYSAWSPVSSFRIDTGERRRLWRQNRGTEFALDTLTNTSVVDDLVQVSGDQVTRTGTGAQVSGGLGFSFTGLPPARAGATATLTVSGAAQATRDFSSCTIDCVNSRTGSVAIALDGSAFGGVSFFSSNCSCVGYTGGLNIPNFQQYIQSDSRIDVLASGRYSNLCGANNVFLCSAAFTLSYATVGSGTITSVPIYLDSFDGAANWESLSFDADPGVTVQVLDANLAPVPNADLPGNAAGLPPGSVMLWHLDRQRYAVIFLRATLDGSERLRRWEVSANDGYRWFFANDSDAEAWQVALDGAAATSAVQNDVLRIEAPAAGTDPRLVYRLPQAVDATRFTELVVRLRSSNNSDNDSVTVFWENNFGLIDPVRSFSSEAFLFQQTDVILDLTQVPTPPKQPWQGRISALRVDPVALFFDPVGQPIAGWVEIDSIWLR